MKQMDDGDKRYQGKEQCECGKEGKCNTQPMQHAMNDRLTVLTLNSVIEAL